MSMEDIFKVGAFAAASGFYEWVQTGTDVYIPHSKCQVKPHSSSWISAVYAAAIVIEINILFVPKDKSSESKLKFRQVSNCCSRVLGAAKLAYDNKTKESITSQKLGCRDFWQIADSVLNKGKSAIPPLFKSPEVLSSASDKRNCWLKTSVRPDKLDFLFCRSARMVFFSNGNKNYHTNKKRKTKSLLEAKI